MKRSILELCFQWAMTFTLFVPSRLFVTSFSSSLPFLTNCCYFRCRSIVLSPSVLFSYNGVNGESDLQLNGHDIPIAATMQLHNENSSASCIDEKRTDGNVETADPHQSDTNASKSSASVAPSTPAETPQIDIESTGSFGTSTTNMFELVADLAAICLYQSDIRRDAIGKATGSQASSATNWIHEASAFALQKAMDQVVMRNPDEAETPSKSTSSSWMERDEITAWVRWCKSMPCPAVLDISSEFQRIVAKSVTTFSEEKSSPSAAASALFLPHIDQMPDEFLSRLGCRMIVLPSGTSLDIPLTEPSSSIVYGKLLYGGVTRARLLGSTSPTPFSRQRKAEVRTEIQPTQKDNVPAWMMYGGPDRVYEAVDMGPAAVLEVVLLPRGKTLRSCSSFTNLHNHGHGNFITRSNASLFRHRKNMIAANLAWSPEIMFDSYQRTVAALGSKAERVKESDTRVSNTPSSLSGSDRNEAFAAGFRSAVGGLQPQIDAIVRRVLDGRVIRPAEEDVSVELKIAHATNSLSISSNAALSSSLDAQELQLLGLSPVRGLLLYGPPGCGMSTICISQLSNWHNFSYPLFLVLNNQCRKNSIGQRNIPGLTSTGSKDSICS